MTYPIHESETGIFQELAKKNDISFGQLSYLIIKPGYIRGGHYHTRKNEWFCCLHGKVRLELEQINTNERRTVILDSKQKEFVEVKPYESHWLKNMSDNVNCEILIIISEEYIKDDPDTFPYNINKT